MNVNELKSSKFLKKEDVEPAVKVTIRSCEQQNVALESQAPDTKWVMYFHEFDKPLVLNSTNGQAISNICGSPESDEWIGREIVLYNDPNVGFQGKITGGIRVRAVRVKPKPATQPQQAQPPAREPGEDTTDYGVNDDIPF